MVLFDSALRLATIAVLIFTHGSVAGSPDDKTLAASISFDTESYSLPVLHVPSSADSGLATIPNRTLESGPELIRFETGDGKNAGENQNVELNAVISRSNISTPEMLEFVTEDGKNSVQINQDYNIILNRTKLMMASKATGKSFPPTDEDFMLHDKDVYKFKPSNGSIFGDPKDWRFNTAGKPYKDLIRNTTAFETETVSSDGLPSAREEKPISFTLLNTNKGIIETENKTSNLSNTARVTEKDSSFNKTVFKGPKNYQTNFRPQFRPSQTINFITNGNRDILKPFYPGVVNSYGEPTVPYGIPPPPAVGFDKINAGVSSLEDVAVQDEGVASVKDTKSILKDLVEKLVRLDLNSTGSLSATHSLDIDGKLLHTAVALSYGRPYRHKITEVPAGTPLSAEDAQDYVAENEKIKKGGDETTLSPATTTATTTATIDDDDDDVFQNDESSNSQDDEYAVTTEKTTTTTKPKPKPKPKPTPSAAPQPQAPTTLPPQPSRKPKPKPTPTPQPQLPTTLPPQPFRKPKPSTGKPNRQNNKMAVKPMKTASPDVNHDNDDNDEYSIDDAAPTKIKSQEIGNEENIDASEPEENYPIVEPIRIKKGTTTTTARPSTAGYEDEDDDVEDDDDNYDNIGPVKPLKPSSGSTNDEGGDDSDDDYYENKLVNTKNKQQDSRPDQDAAFSSRNPVKKRPGPTSNKVAPLQAPVDSSEEVDYYENVPTRTSARPDRTSSSSSGEPDQSRPDNAKRPGLVSRPASDEYSSGFKPSRPIARPPTDQDSVFSDEVSSSSQKHRPGVQGSDEDFYKPVTTRPPPDFSGSDEDFYKPVTTTRKPKPGASGSDEDFYKPVTTTRKPKPGASGSDEDFYKPVTTTRKPKPDASGSDEDFYKPVAARPPPHVSGSEEDFYKPVTPVKRPPPDSSDKDFFKPVTPIMRPPPTKATPYTRLPMYTTHKPFRPSRPISHESSAQSGSSEQSNSSEEKTTTKRPPTTAAPTAATTTVVSTTKKESGSEESYESGESGSHEYYSSEDDYYYSDEYSGSSYDDRDFSHSGSAEYGSDEYRRSKSRDIANGTADAVSGDGEKKLMSGMRMVRRFRKGKEGMRRKRRRQGRKQKLGRRSKDGRIAEGMRLPVKGVKRSPAAVHHAHHVPERSNIKLNGSLDELAKISVLRF